MLGITKERFQKCRKVHILLVFSVFHLKECCRWPSVDVLFIIDSTLNVNQYEHQLQVNFVEQIVTQLQVSDDETHVALSQFTPAIRNEFELPQIHSNQQLLMRLQQVLFAPCESLTKNSNCTPIASINSIARYALDEGNRKHLPDVIVTLSSSKYKIPELLEKEVLMSPTSPIHAFYITISGKEDQSSRFEPSATTIKMSALDFSVLSELVDPLCNSVNAFVGDFQHQTAFGPLCWIIIGVILVIALLIVLMLCYAIYAYREENEQLRYRILQSEKNIKIQNEYFTSKLHSQMEERIKSGEKHAEEMFKHKTTLKEQQDNFQKYLAATPTPQPPAPPAPQQQQQPQPIIIPVYHPSDRTGDHSVTSNKDVVTAEKSTVGTFGNPVFGDKETKWKPQLVNPKKINVNSNENIEVRLSGTETLRRFTDMTQLQLELSNGRVSTRLNLDSDNLQLSQKKNTHSRRNNRDFDSDDSDSEHLKDQHSILKNNGGLVVELEKERSRIDELEDTINGLKKSGAFTSRNRPLDMSRLDFGESNGWKKEHRRRVEEDDDSNSGFSIPLGHISSDHPARKLPAIDLMFLVDSSSSIGISNFDNIKLNICNLLEDMDIAPGRSRVSLIQYAVEPSVVFGFDRYYSLNMVKKGVMRMSYTGGATMLARALSFAAGILYNEQNMKNSRPHKLLPTPRHDKLQVLCVISDGSSEDNVEKATTYLHEKLRVKIFALVTRSFNKSKMVPITRFDGAVFVFDHKESVNLWLWRQQKLWAENYGDYIEREKSMPLSTKRSPKKSHR